MLCVRFLLWTCCASLAVATLLVESDERDNESAEHIGALIKKVTRHPYAASLHYNGTYICSATVLNQYWLLTADKCLKDAEDVRLLVARVGSSYNNKGGELFQAALARTEPEQGVSAVKLRAPLDLSGGVRAMRLPEPDSAQDVALGHLVSILAWTPTGHLRVVGAPSMHPDICEAYAPQQETRYVCIGGVMDPDRHFCRKDNGGAVIQNNTLIAVTAFVRACAQYGKAHAFSKLPLAWLHTVIWDEDPGTPRTTTATTSPTTTQASNATTAATNSTNTTTERLTTRSAPGRYLLNLPFHPVHLPLQPSGDSVLPKLSMYETYLANRRLPLEPPPYNETEEAPSSPRALTTTAQSWLKLYSDQFNQYRHIKKSGLLGPRRKETFDYDYDYSA